MVPALSRSRASTPSIVAAGVVLVATFLLHRGVAPALIDAARCSSLAELGAISFSRLAPHAPLGQWLHVGDGLALAAAMGVLVLLLWRRHGGLIACAVAVAAACAASRQPTLAALPSLVVLGTTVMAAAIEMRFRSLLMTGWALAAMSVPQLAVGLAIPYWLGAASRSSVGSRLPDVVGSLAIALIAILPWLLNSTGPPLAACLLPAAELSTASQMATLTASSFGPFVLGLAVFGAALALKHRWQESAALLALIGVTSFVHTDVVANLPAAIWIFAAGGLAALRPLAMPSVWGTIGVGGLVLLVPLLQAQRWTQARASASTEDLGHAHLSRAIITERLAQLPEGTQLVAEDALTTMLVASAGTRVHVATPRQATAIAASVSASPIYAMPLGQRFVERRGFRLIDEPRAPGFARVSRGGECRVVSDSWRRLSDLDLAEALAIVAREPTETGPAIIYLAFDAVPAIAALDWPTPGRRGIYVTVYHRADQTDARQLAVDRQDDGLTLDWPIETTVVARLELWRPPGAPDALSLSLGRRPVWAAGLVLDRAQPRRLSVCPVFPHTPTSLMP